MSHSFLRESKLYIVYGVNRYRIYTSSAITFNQTFAEESYSVKTLHDQSKMFEGSIINKANPASFSFDVPLTKEKEESIVLTLASDLVSTSESDIEIQQLKSFDIYVQTRSSTFKLEGAVITSASFDFIPTNQFTMRVEGEGKKLTRAGDEDLTIPGNGVSGSNYTTPPPANLPYPELKGRTRTPLIVYPTITLNDGTSRNMNNILSVNLNIQNEMEWTPFETLHDSLNNNTMFPSAHTVGKRIISGEIRQYQQGNNAEQFENFSTNTNLTITAKNVSGDADFFKIQINPAMYTARVNPEEIYTQSYDFRSSDNTGTVNASITNYIN